MEDFLRLGFIEMLAEIRHPVLDALMLLITRLGEEVLFMAVALAFFWCGRKNLGYFLLITGFFGTIVNQALKLAMHVARPWTLDPTFEPVAAAKPAATGFSFPSGHTQSASTLYGGIAYTAKRRSVRILGISLVLLVAFSRLYLGVHTLADVLASLAIGTAVILAFGMVFERIEKNPRLLYAVALVMISVALANVVYASLAGGDFTLPSELENLKEARKNAWSLFGASLGLPVIIFLDERYLRWDGSAKPWQQIVKVAVGLALLLLFKEGMKYLLEFLPGDLAWRHGVRYFLLVLLAGVLYPAVFHRILHKKSA